MKKILLSIIALMTLCLTSAMADTTVTISAEDALWTTTAGEQSGTKGGITIATTSGLFSSSYGQYRSYKGSTFTVTSTVGNITKVEFTCAANGTAQYGPGCFTDATAGTYTASEGATGTWTGDAATFSLTASSNQVRMTQIVVTVGAGGGGVVKKSAGLAWSKTTVNALKGSDFTSPTFSKATTAPVTFKSDDEDIAAVDANGVISIVDEGSATITAESPENDEYLAGKATCVVTVYHNNYYSKVTTIESGAKYLIVAQRNDTTFYAYPVSSSKNYGYLNVGKVAKLSDELYVGSNYNDEFTFTANGNGYNISDATGRYYYQTGTYKSFNLGTDASTAIWGCEPQADGTFKFTMNGYIIQFLTSGTYTEFAVYDSMQDGAKLPFLYKYTGTTPSAIKTVNADTETSVNCKFIQNGQIIIVKNGHKFNTAGQSIR